MPDNAAPAPRKRVARRGDHTDYLAMLGRMLRAGSRRIALADPDDLAEMVELAQTLDDSIARAVAGQRAAGFSWAQIGEPLGMSKQAAQQKWGRRIAALAEADAE